MHEVGRWAGEFSKSVLETLVDKAIHPFAEAFMNAHPVVMGIVGTVVAGGLILLAIVAVASRKKIV